jgi:PAS domain S-box-containing protein
MQHGSNQTVPASSATVQRTAELFAEHQNGIYKRTDRMFAGLMLFQWLAGIAAALWISPRTWIGTQSHIHIHVFAAVVIGGAITSLPVWLAWKRPGHTITRHAIAVGQMLTSALLIHLTGGRIETHFHVFGSLAFLAIYRDWRVLVSATIVVAADHFARGVFWPQSVFGVLTTSPWRWVEHAGWVVFEDFFLMISIRQSVKEMRQIAERQASLERLNQGIERVVEERTQDLQLEIQEHKKTEVRLALQYEVTRTLRESQTLGDAAPKMLRAICESSSWNLGALWQVDSSANMLHCVEVYHAADVKLESFAKKTKGIAITKGVGLPGRVWESGEPAWIIDVQSDPNFPRPTLAVESGLHTALIFPILLGSEVVGVFEFFSREQHKREESLVSLIDNLGRQTGLFLESIQAEAALASERQLLQSLLETSADCIYFKDRESRFLRCSNSQSRRFAGGAAELIGKTDFDLFAEEHARPAFEDEQEIIRTGSPLVGKVEKEVSKDGRESWALTSKMPLCNKAGEIVGTFGISKDVTAIKQAELELERTHKELLQVSRQAGMAEVATSVLHNIGNVLNSVNVSLSVISGQVKKTKSDTVAKVATLMREHAANLGVFMTDDPKGRQLPNFLSQLAEQLAREKAALLSEIDSLTKNIGHIKDIVAMQQNYAKISGVTEKVKVTDLAEDALRMNASALIRHDVRLFREYDEPLPEITVEKHKALQILVNLIRNAKEACDEAGVTVKQLTVRVTNGSDRVRIALTDNGVGIQPDNLNRIFNHGFTTKKDGHGFGLHSSCLAANELGGTLTAHSNGPGKGATFVLELPCQPKDSNT